jgi:hypothetical protein
VCVKYLASSALDARRVGRAALAAVRQMTGDLSPRIARDIYAARVDPHLMKGSEVCPRIARGVAGQLQVVQSEVQVLRRALGSTALAPRVFGHSELGVVPVPYRRAKATLSYLRFLLGLPDDAIPRRALASSLTLAAEGNVGHQMCVGRSASSNRPCRSISQAAGL